MSQTPVLATAPRRKLTKKETEAAERDLRRRMPQLSAVSRNGVFEMIGALYFTWAAGNVPGGPFVPVNVVLRGHNMYVFEGGEAGHRPAGKPRMFFNVKKAVVNDDLGNGTVGLLIIPPLPPHTNVFKLTFDKKQFGWKAFFFKAGTGKELQRWMTDMRWRVNASEAAIKRRFEPMRSREVVCRLTDETETAVFESPHRVVGLSVRYVVNPDDGEIDE